MYAIIESGGKQFKVRRDQRVRLPTLAGAVGDTVSFDRILYASDGEKATAGNPLLQGVKVVGEIVGHGRGRKIVVFKYKKRHRYRRKQGHRQGFTEVAIRELELAGARPGPGRPPAGLEERESLEIGTRPEGGAKRQVGPYVCEECGRGFATERGLQQHRGKAHA
jgi:large subunit ribosomal protein L21